MSKAYPSLQHENGTGYTLPLHVPLHVPLPIQAPEEHPRFGTLKAQSSWPVGMVLVRDTRRRLNYSVVRTRVWVKKQHAVRSEANVVDLMATLASLT